MQTINSSLLYIDSGNTALKVGYYQDGGLQKIRLDHKDFPKFLKKVHSKNSLSHIILSSVNQDEIILKEMKKLSIPFTFIKDFKSDQLFYNMNHQYSKTIGDDRIVQIFYMINQFQAESFALIDAGTFITLDFIKSREFQGGNIFPGFHNFIESYKNGNQLPFLNKEEFIDFLKVPKYQHPRNTEDAIFYSIYQYLKNILDIAAKSSVEDILFTGGDADIIYTMAQIENYDFNIHLEDNLIFKSMEFFGQELTHQGYLQ
jgi:type III pantothenate kinase